MYKYVEIIKDLIKSQELRQNVEKEIGILEEPKSYLLPN